MKSYYLESIFKTKNMFKIIAILLTATICATYIVEPGPVIKATKGEIWPKPKQQTKSEVFSVIRPTLFTFEVTDHKCDLLEKATLRYIKLITNLGNHEKRNSRFRQYIERNSTIDYNHVRRERRQNRNCRGYLDSLQIKLTQPCTTLPTLNMNESYVLVHKDGAAALISQTIWGVLRGLESFSQMLVVDEIKQSLIFNETEIHDEPRFSHRGLLIDTSRHYLNIFTIYRIIDGMTYNKLNVLHWHIVDDHSFPYESVKFPELSEKGAYHPTMTYTQNDVSDIIEYARVRGIRVMPEFDTPGHTRSWGISHPEILTECGVPYEGSLGPMDPTLQETYDFTNELFKEIVTVFLEKYIHLGGDEVGFECWASNAFIKTFMKERNITKYEDLEGLFIKRIIDQVTQLNASSVVWQEVFENGVEMPQSTVVHVWKGNRRELLSQITLAGHKLLTSEGWYLDYLKNGGDWKKYYQVDPHDFDGTPAQKKLILGGEACMWGEVVDDTNVIQRIFPRTSAIAERLWSYFNNSDDYNKVIANAEQRLEEHTCRMIFRGIPSQPPNGPGFCT